MHRSRRQWQRACGAAFAALAVATFTAACRKAPPDEVVFTGRPAPTGQVPHVDAGPIPVWDGGGEEAGAPFTRAGLLRDFATCAVERYRAFVPLARSLRDAAAAWASDLTEEHAATARDAWLAAMASWEEVEVMQFGPSARSPAPGAQDLRDQIYAWPLFSRCKVDEQIVAQSYASPGIGSSLINARGLGAMEYLAFHAGTDNGCSKFSSINADGTWAALGAVELAQRKARYATAAADDVVLRATTLADAWDPAKGDFARQLATAGAGSQTFPTEADAFNAVSDALFYVEREVKDWKLGKPLGYLECEATTCPEALESPFARASTAHIRANLIGARRLFQGCGEGYAGLGFDDWLRSIGASDLADRMMGALVGAQDAVDALSPPIEQALAADPTKVAVVHASVKAFTDLLKTEFVTVLRLELPKSSDGDND